MEKQQSLFVKLCWGNRWLSFALRASFGFAVIYSFNIHSFIPLPIQNQAGRKYLHLTLASIKTFYTFAVPKIGLKNQLINNLKEVL